MRPSASKPMMLKPILFTARAVSLGILTNKILMAAWEVPKGLLSGAVASTMTNWRYITETKNIAMMIDMDIDGKKGFLWLHHKMIEHAGAEAGDGTGVFADQAKQILEEAGFKYKRADKEPWAKEVNGKKYGTSVERSGYVWHHRKFPPELSKSQRSNLAEAEQELLRLSNKFAHPTLASPEMIKDKVPRMVISTAQATMSVMLAYKVAASDLAGWQYTRTVGEQFHIYPPDQGELETLSYMVEDLYDHCSKVIWSHYMGEEQVGEDQ